jgi:sodium transport system permease protein
MKSPFSRQAGTIFRATLIDQSRDRRSVGAAFIYALSGPLLLLAMFMMMGNEQDDDQPPQLAVYGAQHAPELLGALEEAGARIERRSGDPGSVAQDPPQELGDATVILLVPEEYVAAAAQERTGTVTLLRDERSRRSMADARRIQDQIRDHGDQLASSRLEQRGVSPEVAQPVSIEGVNVAPTAGRDLGTARMILIFLILAPFFTSMTAAIDATAGERERQSLKPLLAQPVTPASIIIGKWGVSSIFGIAGTAATIVLGLLLLRLAPLETLGIDLRLDLATQAAMIVLLIPLALAVAALQSLVAMLAKSFKEAQTYIQLLSFAPLAILMVGMFSEPTEGVMASNMPVTGHAELMTSLLSEGKMDMAQALMVTLTTLAVTILALIWSQKQLSNEKMIGQN